MNPLREALNERKWKTRDLDKVTIVVTHRGAPDDLAYLSGAEIEQILEDGVQLAGEDGAFIPYHRMREIRG